MKLNAKISEIASPKTVFDKKLPALSAIYIDKPVGPRFGQVVSKMYRTGRFCPRIAFRGLPKNGREVGGGERGKRGGYFLKRRNIFISP